MTTKIVGLDIGTMFMISAHQQKEKVKINTCRNVFLPISEDMISSSEIANSPVDYVESKDEKGETDAIFIIGEDAHKFGNIFNQTVRRPMEHGVISSSEIDAIDVLTLMVEKLVGKAKNGYCVFSVPAPSIDSAIPPVLYHEKVFSRILSSLGYKSKSINEGMAVVFSECQKDNFSGIAISFGAGLTNLVCSYKGMPTLTFSVDRAGDWIDSSTASSLGIISNRVTSIKERGIYLINPSTSKKKERRVKEALVYYYRSLIEYVLNEIVKEFNKASDNLDIDESIPIVVSGGTSLPKGFIELFKEIFSGIKDFPYNISEIRHAKDPLNAVATGALIYAAWDMKRQNINIPKEEKLMEE